MLPPIPSSLPQPYSYFSWLNGKTAFDTFRTTSVMILKFFSVAVRAPLIIVPALKMFLLVFAAADVFHFHWITLSRHGCNSMSCVHTIDKQRTTTLHNWVHTIAKCASKTIKYLCRFTPLNRVYKNMVPANRDEWNAYEFNQNSVVPKTNKGTTPTDTMVSNICIGVYKQYFLTEYMVICGGGTMFKAGLQPIVITWTASFQKK